MKRIINNIARLILVFILIAPSATKAQDTIPGIQNLTVGDQFPDFSIEKIVNSPKRTANSGDYKNQLLLIDFWATSCSGCVAALPHMAALQKQFGSELKILPVTYEKESQVLAFWKSNKYTRNLNLPSVVEDKIFESYFKHLYIPHEVWVYKGKVIGITGPDYVNENNIQKILNGEQIKWPVKNDFYVFDQSKPLFNLDPDQIDTSSTFVKYAAISDYKEKVSSVGMGLDGLIRDAGKKTVRTFLINMPIYNAYVTTWASITGYGKNVKLVKPGSFSTPQFPNEVIWEVLEKSKYKFDPKLAYQQQYVRDNAICFESLQSDSGQSDQAVYQSVIRNLDRLLGLRVRWEKRKEKVWVLVKTSDVMRLSSSLTGLPLTSLAWNMNKEADNPYVFDETGYRDGGTLNIKINNWKDIASIRKAILPYGLDLKQEERLVDKFVFTEINGGLFLDKKMMEEGLKRKNATMELKVPSTEEVNSFLEANKKTPGVITLPSGLQYKSIKNGTGAKPGIDDKVLVNYTGKLINGKIFDSSFEKGRPILFGVNQIIKGLTEALQLMPVGSKWELYIPAGLGYGGEEQYGIPANSALIFELELLSINK